MDDYFLEMRKQTRRFLNLESLQIRKKRVSRIKKRNILTLIILVLCMRLFFYVFFEPNVYAQESKKNDRISAEIIDPLNKIDKGIINPDADDDIKNAKLCDKKAENLIETEKENKNRKREDKLKEIIKGYPIFEMIPYLVERDEKTAALLVAIARKESTWGVHAPSKNGQDCYNYWGYKGNYNLVKGYSCFDSPKQAVEVVGDKIDQLIAKKIDTPEELVVWKCGSSCAGHDPESVHSWVKSVREYWEKILG